MSDKMGELGMPVFVMAFVFGFIVGGISMCGGLATMGRAIDNASEIAGEQR